MTPEAVLLLLRIAIAVALYAILLLVISSLRQDLKVAQMRPLELPSAHLHLEEHGERFPLAVSNIVGRAWESSIRIQDETISSSHARISYQERQWWLEDLGSRNGTTLNDIEVLQPLVIAEGDLLQFGRVAARFVISEPVEEK